MFCFIVEHVVRQARVTGGKRKQLEDSDHGGKWYKYSCCMYAIQFSCEP